MPSSLIFAGLVVSWLLILVPEVARHRQEVARPSPAALSGRVLERPYQRRRAMEVDGVDQTDDVRSVATQEPDRAERRVWIPAGHGAGMDEPMAGSPVGVGGLPVGVRTAVGTTWGTTEADDHPPEDEHPRRRPSARYRPGRGGYDPEAAALAARARYGVRQRVVLGLLVTAVLTALVAAVVLAGLWWLHLVVDLALVGYLGYLRRQVRTEEEIRERRAARMAGTRRTAADGPALDGPALDDGSAVRRGPIDDHCVDEDVDTEGSLPNRTDGVDERERVHGTGEPVGVLRAHPHPIGPDVDGTDPGPALPRLRSALLPPLPVGTSLVDVDEEDDELAELDGPYLPERRRAAGA